ncbi:hypothetical protein C8Q74DRAFT_1371012 [Fomes fomentarius]|nr:hypothetical protein C8Q74DRAFT_1371012 [Fomes fomentarius]
MTSRQATPQPLDASIDTANMVGVLLSNITYGVHLALFISLIRVYVDHSLYAPWRRPPFRVRSEWRPLAYATLLFVFATTGFCLQTWLDHEAFIAHRDYPGGPLLYIAAQAKSPRNISLTAVYVILNWLADGMLLYRFYVIYQRQMWALLLSILMLVSLIGVGTVSLPNISMLIVNLWTDNSTALSLAYLILSFSINVILTFAIAFRLLCIRRTMRKALGDRSSIIYTSTVAMFVESASLYTIVALICIVACGVSSPLQNALLPMLGQWQAIPPLLITIRVMEHRDRRIEFDPRTEPSTLEFRHPVGTVSSESDAKPPPYGPYLEYPVKCAERTLSVSCAKCIDTELGGVHGPKPHHFAGSLDACHSEREWEDMSESQSEEGWMYEERRFEATSGRIYRQ